jgi:hypothetical protein
MLFVVRFSTTHDVISWAIRHRTDFFISHVEFQIVRSWIDARGEIHPAGSTLGSRFPSGVKWREPIKNIKQRNAIVVARPGTDIAAQWLDANRIGYKYDLRGIFGIASGNRDWHDKKERFCSEAVTEAFEEGPKEQLFNPWAKCWEITPRDVFLARGWTVLSGPKNLKRIQETAS